jgi:serine protease Do
VPVGLEVYAVGYPFPRMLGLSKKITAGIINGERPRKGEVGHFLFSAEIQKGNSGGPILAPDRSVVGVAQRKMDALKIAEKVKDLPQNVNYGLKSAQLIEFLKAAGLKTEPVALNLAPGARPYEVFRGSEAAIVAVLGRNKPGEDPERANDLEGSEVPDGVDGSPGRSE